MFVVSGAKGREEEFRQLPPNTIVVKSGVNSGDDGDDGSSEIGEDHALAAAESHAERSNDANDEHEQHDHEHDHDALPAPAYMQYSHTRTGAPVPAPPTSVNRIDTSVMRRASVVSSAVEGAPPQPQSTPIMGPHTPTTSAALQAQQQQQQQQQAQQTQQQQQHAQAVGGAGYPGRSGYADPYVNVNPALNNAGASSGDITVMNVLEANPQPNVLEQMQAVDSGLLAGIPGGMFDWRK